MATLLYFAKVLFSFICKDLRVFMPQTTHLWAGTNVEILARKSVEASHFL